MKYSESNYSSDYEEDDDLMTIKKFLNTISEEIFSPFKDPIPDIEEFSKNPGNMKKNSSDYSFLLKEMTENFFHQFFIRENYIKMLIQIICTRSKILIKNILLCFLKIYSTNHRTTPRKTKQNEW